MKLEIAAAFSIMLFSVCSPAYADFRLPEEISRVEGPRDMHLFQLEPTILNERFFTSGRAERHQYVGKVLPYGAPIPDNDGPVKTNVTPLHPAAPTAAAPQAAPSPAAQLQTAPSHQAVPWLEPASSSHPTSTQTGSSTQTQPDSVKPSTDPRPSKSTSPQSSSYFRLKGLPEEIGRVEASRDMNMFALEPSILHERFYNQGGAERHQFVGNVLPFGAPIPDNI